mmetsp:Transcript_364/g.761  ORF Transcript_364/g.761 Transcript_364/m.761 type:complete len:291 (-) Transcript_364:194-1066(-)
MSTGIDPTDADRREARLARSPRLSGTSPQILSGSSGSGGYRPRSRSLASASLIAPASAYSPSLSSVSSSASATPPLALPPPAQSPLSSRRRLRAASLGSYHHQHIKPPATGGGSSRSLGGRKIAHDPIMRERARTALEMNDSMVYLDGPQVYACQQCRTHLTSHDDIISKSFHGRRGRAYLFDQCVNVTEGTPEDRLLITGLHSVCDIFCQRCNTLVGWTYKRAYEASQKYKEGKFIIEKINLYLEESDTYSVEPPAGERRDRWRQRSRSWGSEGGSEGGVAKMVYEYAP